MPLSLLPLLVRAVRARRLLAKGRMLLRRLQRRNTRRLSCKIRCGFNSTSRTCRRRGRAAIKGRGVREGTEGGVWLKS